MRSTSHVLGPKWQAAFRPLLAGLACLVSRAAAASSASTMRERQLHRHMPELVPVWRRQVELAGGDELAARFLTFWNSTSLISSTAPRRS